MKNMYAIKCLYQYKFYDKNDELLKDIIPGWEEKIILIEASSLDEADNKSKAIAKEYESNFENVDNQIVKVRLYEILDIFAIFDTTDKTNIEVYSKMFNAITDTIENLKKAQIEAEEEYLKLYENNDTTKIVKFSKKAQ